MVHTTHEVVGGNPRMKNQNNCGTIWHSGWILEARATTLWFGMLGHIHAEIMTM